MPTPTISPAISIRRGLALVLAFWTLLIAGSLSWNLWAEQQAMLHQVAIEAEANFEKDVAFRRWAAQQGGVYAPVSSHIRPNPYLVKLPERDLTTPSGRRLTLVNPAYMTRQVYELAARQSGIRGHITSAKPIRPGNRPDRWESQALAAFSRGEKLCSTLSRIDGQPFFRFMRPFLVEQDCLGCHDSQGYQVGDVAGGISISIPMAPYYVVRRAQFLTMGAWHFLIYLTGCGLLLWGGAIIRRRLLENEQARRGLDLDRQRFESLFAIARMRCGSERELIDFALAESVRLSSSELGYFHFYHPDSQEIELYAWNSAARRDCGLNPAELKTRYPLAETGVWADCLRGLTAVIHNDLGSLPSRKGYPAGHVAISRYLGIPILEQGQARAVLGVANKPGPYTEDDVLQLNLFAATLWELLKARRVEGELQGERQRLALFRELMEQSNDAVFIADPETGRILDVNLQACRSLGYSREELLGLTVMEVDPNVVEAAVWQQRSQALRDKPNAIIISEHRRRDGVLFPVEINASYLTHGERGYVLGTVRDISDRRRAAEELKCYQTNLEGMVAERTAELNDKTQALERSQEALLYLLEDVNDSQRDLQAANQRLTELDRLKSMFIASMSHELRTPLNSIIGFSTILLNEWSGHLNPEQKTNQAIVLKNGQHLLALINDVIDLSKVEAGMIESSLEEFDLDGLIKEAVDGLRPEIGRKGLTLDAPDCRITLVNDRRRLLQCVINLLGNAVKFTDQGGITVQASLLAGERVAIVVRDTGIGIREEDQARLFSPFTRLDPNNSKYPGTGLGLYLSRKLALEVLGGEITVRSLPGEGSVFTITISQRRRT